MRAEDSEKQWRWNEEEERRREEQKRMRAEDSQEEQDWQKFKMELRVNCGVLDITKIYITIPRTEEKKEGAGEKEERRDD